MKQKTKLLTAGILGITLATAITPLAQSSTKIGKDYTFTQIEDGKPLHWSTCKPITWSFPTAVGNDLKHTRNAFKQIAKYTKATFKMTNKNPQIKLKYHVSSGGYADGGFQTQGREKSYPVSGLVRINPPFKNPNYHNHDGVRPQLYLHELGHVMGLGHAKNRKNIMYPTIYGDLKKFGPGDINGLKKLGGCYSTDITPPTNIIAKFVQNGTNWDDTPVWDLVIEFDTPDWKKANKDETPQVRVVNGAGGDMTWGSSVSENVEGNHVTVTYHNEQYFNGTCELGNFIEIENYNDYRSQITTKPFTCS